jgi:hypothetical protein
MTTRRIALATTAGAAAMALIAAGVLVGSAQAQPTSAASGNGRAGNSTHTSAGTHAGTGTNPGTGSGSRNGAGNAGAARGSGVATATAALTTQQTADLLGMVEEEKLAGDVYATLAAQYGDAELARIAASEDKHAASLRRLLTRYGIADPTAGFVAGEFPTASFQALYDDLVARGSVSLVAADAVGAEIERMDIDDLTDAIATATGRTDVQRVYTNLRNGSQHHLAAFTG